MNKPKLIINYIESMNHTIKHGYYLIEPDDKHKVSSAN